MDKNAGKSRDYYEVSMRKVGRGGGGERGYPGCVERRAVG
jgi:hypothetical protein